MNNDIKEILDGLNAVIKQEGSLELDFKECKKILYYITNLQEENEQLKQEKELHANSVEFNINNDKRDCIITLDENDLGIDKLHLDNCYFYKENGKWYVKKYDFKTIKLEEEKKITPKDFENLGYALGSIKKYINKGYDKAIEEKKIPEKLNLDKDELRGKETPRTIDYLIEGKINEVIDYLKSKGDE